MDIKKNSLDNETREEYIRRLAKNRHDMRVHFNFRMSDTPEDDWKYAEEAVRQEEIRRANEGR